MRSLIERIIDKLLSIIGFEEVDEQETPNIKEIANDKVRKESNASEIINVLSSLDKTNDSYTVDHEAEKTVVSMIAKDKAIAIVELLIMSGLFILFIMALSRFVHALEFTNIFVLLIVFLNSIAYLNYKIFQYRVRKGLYGTNEAESREIIAYILSSIQYFKGTGKKDITINEDVVEQVYELISKSGRVKTGESHA